MERQSHGARSDSPLQLQDGMRKISMRDFTDRHPGTRELAAYFVYGHLRSGHLQDTSKACAILAEDMIDLLPDGPELRAGLRKLLEAKDCFVRQALKL